MASSNLCCVLVIYFQLCYYKIIVEYDLSILYRRVFVCDIMENREYVLYTYLGNKNPFLSIIVWKTKF